MSKTIIVENCGKCPFNYDTIRCVIADGDFRVIEDGLPEDCPLEAGEAVVRK